MTHQGETEQPYAALPPLEAKQDWAWLVPEREIQVTDGLRASHPPQRAPQETFSICAPFHPRHFRVTVDFPNT